ncbi:hypothetical protein K9M09_00680 [Patescibacteria group bacterium]|nr:hypothetical protein [Patescibacteria group bacterium]
MNNKTKESSHLKQIETDSLSADLVRDDERESSSAMGMDANQDLRALLRENLEMTKEIRAMVRHINVYVAWQRIFGWLKVLLIVVSVASLVIGIIYLPPIFTNAYQNLLQLITGNLNAGC